VSPSRSRRSRLAADPVAGFERGQLGSGRAPSGATCPSCDRVAPAGARFCPRCGASLAGGNRPEEALIEATRVVASGVAEDLDAVLDALTDQARRLLGADAATLHLAVPGEIEFVRRRANPLAPPGSPPTALGARFKPGPLTREAIERRWPVFTGGYQQDPRSKPDVRGALPEVVATMSVPLFARAELVGVLYLDWTRPYQATGRDLRLADAFARHAAVAIHSARLYQQVRAALRVRDEFLSVAAHELKTPITAVKGLAQTLRRSSQRGPIEAARLQSSLDKIDRAATRLTALVEDLLNVSRIRLDRLPIRAHRTDLTALIGRWGQVHAPALAPSHRLITRAPAEPIVARVDPARIRQVLDALVRNAVRYSPDGGEVGLELAPAEGGARIAVRDHGIGLSPGSEEVIFEPFGHSPNAALQHLPGIGLGLYVCRVVVEGHGGRIWAESPGEHQGTTFLIWLPTV
jgi:signal transduction histidine kinase